MAGAFRLNAGFIVVVDPDHSGIDELGSDGADDDEVAGGDCEVAATAPRFMLPATNRVLRYFL